MLVLHPPHSHGGGFIQRLQREGVVPAFLFWHRRSDNGKTDEDIDSADTVEPLRRQIVLQFR